MKKQKKTGRKEKPTNYKEIAVYITKLVWLFVIPFVLSVMIIPYEQLPLKFVMHDNRSALILPDELVNPPGGMQSIRQVFSAPFNLKYYKLHVLDYSEVTPEIGCEFYWEVKIRSSDDEEGYTGRIDNLQAVRFQYLEIGDLMYYEIAPVLVIDPAHDIDDPCELNPQILGIATPYHDQIVASRLLFIIAWIGLTMLFKEVFLWLIPKHA